MAFSTLPPLRQRVQMYARWALPAIRTRTFCRFGLKRRFVATIEWLRLFPKPGFFPQSEQILDMRLGSVAKARTRASGYLAAAARRFANRSAISSPVRTDSAPFS